MVVKYRSRKDFEKLMDDYKSGKKGIQPGHPEEIETAIKTFLEYSVMLTEFPEIDSIPPEVIDNLLKTLIKYPEYNSLTMELINILDGYDV